MHHFCSYFTDKNQLPSSPGRLPRGPPLSYSRPRGFPLTHQTSWWTPLPFSLPSFQGLAQDFLHDLISSYSYDVLVSTIFASSPVSFCFTLFQLPPLVRASVPSDTRASGVTEGICLLWLCQESLYPLKATYTFHSGRQSSSLQERHGY